MKAIMHLRHVSLGSGGEGGDGGGTTGGMVVQRDFISRGEIFYFFFLLVQLRKRFETGMSRINADGVNLQLIFRKS